MTDKKITALTELAYANLADDDVLAVVDISDTTMDASGTTKKIKAVPDRVRAASFAGNGGTETVTADAGNVAAGFVSGYSPYTAAVVSSGGKGSFAQGYAIASGVNASLSATERGAFAQGFAGYGDLLASGVGSFVQGATRGGGGLLTSTAAGSFVQGYVYQGSITSSGLGSFAQGYTTYGAIVSAAKGTFAQGYVSDAGQYIKAEGEGSIAQGKCHGAFNIHASGDACFAQGYTEFSDIIATGQNTVQFGCGTNDVANSLQVGLNVRLHSDGWLELKETFGQAPPANAAYLFTDDNGSGKTRLMVQFATGAAIQLAIQA